MFFPWSFPILARAIRRQEPIKLSAEDKLNVLRQLDRWRSWNSLQDKRSCLVCGQLLSGREIEVVGGTRDLGPLRLHCPTENCPSIPMDWVLPHGEQSVATVPSVAAVSTVNRSRNPSPRRTASLSARLRNVVSRIRSKQSRKRKKQKS